MTTNPTKGRPFTTACVLVAFSALLVGGCDDSRPRNPYVTVQPDQNFSRYQLQCAVDAIEDQREAHKEMNSWKRCQSSLPRLEELQTKLREEWKIAELEKWNRRCENEISSLRFACEQKRDEALANLPDHLRIPPRYSSTLKPRRTLVTEYQWRQANKKADIQEVAASIVLDEVESRARLASSLFPQLSSESKSHFTRTQEEEDLSDIRNGFSCAVWIGREAPNADLLTEEYLHNEIEKLRGGKEFV